jgi:hypothetical protein
MNEALRRRTRRGVTRTGAVAKFSIALAAAGCASGARPAVIVGDEPGTTTVLVDNRLDEAAELRRVRIEIDGVSVPVGTVPPRGGGPAVVARAPEAPGAHTLGLVAVAARAEGHDVMILRSSQAFRVGRGPAVLRIALVGGAASAGAVAANVTISGGALETPADEAPARDADRCAYLEAIPLSLCRAELALAEAATSNDAARAACIVDKVGAMRAVAEMLRGRADLDATVTDEAEARVRALGSAIDRCAGIADVSDDGLTRTPM